jgi:6-phosphogluconolactonase
MHRIKAIVAGAVALAALVLVGAAMAGDDHPGAVYTLTNSPAGNAVAVFDRAADGTLTAAGTFPTGGLGSGAGLGSQNSLVLVHDTLFAVNSGSNQISVLDVQPNGVQLVGVVGSGGTQPISLTVSGKLLYVLNAGTPANISGFRIDGDGLTPLAGSTRPLSPGASGPAQVSFGPKGDTLVVTEKTSNTIDTYTIGKDGLPSAPIAHASTGGVPFGFDFAGKGYVLVSNASGSASSYALGADGSLDPVGGPVPTNQAAPCWLVSSKNGRYAYTANAGAGSISGFAVAKDGSLTLLNASGVTASTGPGSHPLDEAVSENGRFLYVLTDGYHTVTGFAIGEDGSLTQVTQAGALPPGDVGLAAR